MSVVSIVEAIRTAGLWRRLGLALDRYLAERAKGSVPSCAVRRSRQDIVRCRRLTLKRAPSPSGSAAPRTASRYDSGKSPR